MKSTQQSSLPPLGPISKLPAASAGLKQWKVLMLVTAANSFTQRVMTYLKYLGIENTSVQIATSDEAMQGACERWNPDLVICPFLTRRIDESVFSRWITLVVHPGPPGDAGPSSLDWVLMGDTGMEADSTKCLDQLLKTPMSSWYATQRSHWGTIVFQANEHLDGGAIWAWEQYPLPAIGSITKAQLYQGPHSQGAMTALITAMMRVYETASALPKDHRMCARPQADWQRNSVTHQSPFLGGQTHERPLLQSKTRKPDFSIHSAEDVQRIIHASDSQPGAQLAPLTADSKTSLFAYGAHLQASSSSVPKSLYISLGYENYDDIPDGKILATREGAIFIKTHQPSPIASTQCASCASSSSTSSLKSNKDTKEVSSSAGVWITHGRVPKKAGTPLEPKVPMVQAILSSGHKAILDNVPEWEQETFAEVPGTWQEVYVRSLKEEGEVVQCVYWNFYNGAFSTRQCQLLLQACQWATAPERGNVKVLALMGGNYFSNGIALNTIEASSDPGRETWDNINGIDDIIEYLVSDTHAERSPFMDRVTPLCERGIVTVACLRGNAAAGGVALAASCDVVIAGRGVVLNPAYRAMGLHGSEFHSFCYLTRCGEKTAAAMLRDMMPQSSTESLKTGLVDVEIGSATSSPAEIESLCVDELRSLVNTPASQINSHHCAPWCSPSSSSTPSFGSLVDAMAENKRHTYRYRTFAPLLHYRNEELSQMLLDSFHPVRSKRYHERRYKFIRKVKSDGTPARYAKHVVPAIPDAEDLASFDDAPGWIRGEEWSWANLPIPASLATSESTRIPLYPSAKSTTQERTSEPQMKLKEAIQDSDLTPSIHTTSESADEKTRNASMSSSEEALPITPSPTVHLNAFNFDKHNSPRVNTAPAVSSERKSSAGSSTQVGSSPTTPKIDRSKLMAQHHHRTQSSVSINDTASIATQSKSKFRTVFTRRFSKVFGSQSQSQTSGAGQGRKSGDFDRSTVSQPRKSMSAASTATAMPRISKSESRRNQSICGPEVFNPPSTNQQQQHHSSTVRVRGEYQQPQIVNADQCEFPCLYDADNVPENTAEVEQKQQNQSRQGQGQGQGPVVVAVDEYGHARPAQIGQQSIGRAQ